MDKTQLYALTGHLEQVASVRRVVYQDGDAAGLCCAQFRNGPLEFDVMLNKCLDLAQLRYPVSYTHLTLPTILRV